MTNPKDSQAELRTAIYKIFYHLGVPSADTGMEKPYVIDGADQILALFQAREQQLLTKEREPMNNNTNYEIGKDVVLEMLGDGKYKVYANPKYIEAAKQQLLTELLGELPKYVRPLGVTDDHEKGFNLALSEVVSVIKRYISQTKDSVIPRPDVYQNDR